MMALSSLEPQAPGTARSRDTARIDAAIVSFTGPFGPRDVLAQDVLAQNDNAPTQTQPVPTGVYVSTGKRALDIALVLLTLPVTVPLTLLCAFVIWAEAGNPIFRKTCLGHNGRMFRALKLRTMTCDAQSRLAVFLKSDPRLKQEWDSGNRLARDPRITPVGAVLRATSMDDLPSLWNVLKGDMSLVGPRALTPGQLAFYGDTSRYFQMRPGLVGTGGCSTPNMFNLKIRARQDATYFTRVSLRSDLGILCRSFSQLCTRAE